jgi:hypothetical protein
MEQRAHAHTAVKLGVALRLWSGAASAVPDLVELMPGPRLDLDIARRHGLRLVLLS